MAELLTFLNQQNEPVTVVIGAPSLLARDARDAADIIGEITSRGGIVKLPSRRRLPTVEALSNRVASSLRAATVRGLRARLEAGYWPFRLPTGLVRKRGRKGATEVVLDRKVSTLVREAFGEFSCRPDTTVEDIERYLSGQRFFGRRPANRRSNTMAVHRMLRNPLYAGYVEYAPWGVTRRKGKHPQIVPGDTFERVQAKLLGEPITYEPLTAP